MTALAMNCPTPSEELELDCSSEAFSEPPSPGCSDSQSPEPDSDSELQPSHTTNLDHVDGAYKLPCVRTDQFAKVRQKMSSSKH